MRMGFHGRSKLIMAAQQVLLDDHPRLDGLSQAHLVGEEDAAVEAAEHSLHRLHLEPI